MAATNSISDTLNANYKQVYGDDIVELIPDGVKVLNDLKFVEGDKAQGGTYNQPVATALEHGFSFGAGEDVINLDAAVAGKLENASVTGTQMVGRAQWGWTAAARAVNSKAAFRNVTEVVLTNLMTSHKKKSEAMVLYGQSGLGTVTSVSGSDIRLSSATSAEGLWFGAKNMPIEVRDSNGVLIQNTKITAVTLAATAPFVTLTVETIGSIAQDHLIYFKGAYGKEYKGIHKILTQTGGTLLGISQTTYPDLWQGTTSSAGGQATYQKIVRGATDALPKGGEGKYKVYIHPQSWQDVVNDMETARDFSAQKPSVLERGVDSIKFHSVGGTMELVAHTCIWRGYAYGILQDRSFKRIGSTDITNRIPGMQGADQQFLVLENTAGIESRTYSDFAVMCDAPARHFVITGITQSA